MFFLFRRQQARDLGLGLVLLCAALALMLYPQQSMAAAREGLSLCGNVIIPSLFPFFVLSSLVVELGLAGYVGRLVEGIMRPVFRVGGVCASALVLGLIGGYPVGAKTAIRLYEKGMCTRAEAQRLLAFCNNSGPAFILGVVGAGVFSDSRVGLLLYLTHVAASVCVGLLFRFYRPAAGGKGAPAPSPLSFQAQRFAAAFTGCVKSAFLSTLNICAFVVFFTVVIRLLFLTGILPGIAKLLGLLFSPLGFTPQWGERLLTGVLEISSGVWSLSGEGISAGGLSMAAFILGWAGLSVHCQTLSFLDGSGLSVNTYLAGKLLHGFFSALFAALLARLFPLGAPVWVCLAEQVDGLAGLDFHVSLTISTVCAWVTFLLCLLAAAAAARKGLGKGRRPVL